MPLLRLSRRDTVLVLLGALCMHIFSSLFGSPFERSSSIVINTHLDQYHNRPNLDPLPPPPEPPVTTPASHAEPLAAAAAAANQEPPPVPIDQALELPETTIVSHAPGWTIFRNLYMAGGTFYIVSPHPPSHFPDIRYMVSISLFAQATAENIAAREPTSQEMDFLTPRQAKVLWGGDVEFGQKNRIWSVEGNTLLCNDPDQFLDHYYHFVAELLLGAWAFWSGTFIPSSVSSNHILPRLPAPSTSNSSLHRAIFAHSTSEGWRDRPGFNAYVLRSAFPSLTVEVEDDWLDRIDLTPKTKVAARAWHFPLVLIADRSAAFRGKACGQRTQRTAAEAFEAMTENGQLDRSWWEPIRKAVVRFAGGDPDGGKKAMESPTRVVQGGARKMVAKDNQPETLPIPDNVVITYISRQGTNRRLIQEDHQLLVESLEDLVDRKGWHLNVIQAERLSKDEQVRIMGTTTIMLGVHGNGLTHLVLMPPTRVSAVIEMFIPGGFAHDYEWTTRALGMRHFAVWNDTYHSHPKEPQVDYPEGFQGSQIPAHGPSIAKLIEDRVEGRL